MDASLVTALVGMASVVSLIQTVVDRPHLVILPFIEPPEYRKHAGVLLLALLTTVPISTTSFFF